MVAAGISPVSTSVIKIYTCRRRSKGTERPPNWLDKRHKLQFQIFFMAPAWSQNCNKIPETSPALRNALWVWNHVGVCAFRLDLPLNCLSFISFLFYVRSSKGTRAVKLELAKETRRFFALRFICVYIGVHRSRLSKYLRHEEITKAIWNC